MTRTEDLYLAYKAGWQDAMKQLKDGGKPKNVLEEFNKYWKKTGANNEIR